MKIIKTKDATKVVLERIKALTKSEVLVGIPDANAARTDAEDAEKKGEPINNAVIGYVHEFGLPEKNIPARPHLFPGISDAKDRIAKVLGNGARKVLSGDAGAGESALTRAGTIAETAVKERIKDGLSPPLAAATVRNRFRGRQTKKMRKGEVEYLRLVAEGKTLEAAASATGIKPLDDTGQYLKAITHVVRPKGDA